MSPNSDIFELYMVIQLHSEKLLSISVDLMKNLLIISLRTGARISYGFLVLLMSSLMFGPLGIGTLIQKNVNYPKVLLQLGNRNISVCELMSSDDVRDINPSPHKFTD